MNYKYYKNYCKDIENVENYDKAKADNFIGWHCHHRLETHNSDGERRLVDISKKELIALDMYWNRSASELIFLTTKEHLTLHRKGKPTWNKEKHHSEETKRKISEANKGRQFSDEHRKRLSEARKGIYLSEEHKKRISEALKGKTGTMKGKHHSEETRKRISAKSKGRRHSEETRKKISETHKGILKGRRHFNNGKISVMCYECPEGFVPGRLFRKR